MNQAVFIDPPFWPIWICWWYMMKTTEILYAGFSLYSQKCKAIFPFRDVFNLDQFINYSSLYSNILCRTKHSAINSVTIEYVRYLNFELKFKLTIIIDLSSILTFIVENHSRQGKNPSCIWSKVLQSAIRCKHCITPTLEHETIKTL